MPPKVSAAAQVAVEYALEAPKLAPPGYLTAEQAAFWREIVAFFPAERFGPDHVPVLSELVRHMATSAQLNEQLAELRKRDLNRHSAKIDAQRNLFLQLATAAREEAKLIAALSTKLRLTPDVSHTQQKADAERRANPPGARPWSEGEATTPKPWEVPADATAN
jgi:hypothetical protein